MALVAKRGPCTSTSLSVNRAWGDGGSSQPPFSLSEVEGHAPDFP